MPPVTYFQKPRLPGYFFTSKNSAQVFGWPLGKVFVL